MRKNFHIVFSDLLHPYSTGLCRKKVFHTVCQLQKATNQHFRNSTGHFLPVQIILSGAKSSLPPPRGGSPPNLAQTAPQNDCPAKGVLGCYQPKAVLRSKECKPTTDFRENTVIDHEADPSSVHGTRVTAIKINDVPGRKKFFLQ